MSIDSKYEPNAVEEKWYKEWIDNKCFQSSPNPNKSPYVVVIPPPNVTGILHMGHMLNNTIQDVLVRKARMSGKETCWVAGTDHASIATEAKVVSMLKKQGIEKNDLTREDFLKYAYKWKDKYGGIILKQLRKLGASCDWDRTRFTMDDKYYKEVISVFVDLYNKGRIYRGVRMVNWDPQGKTAVSDEEVIRKEVQSQLYYVKYQLEGTDELLTVATTRPETIMGDTAVCVHPEDERYKHLIGKNIIIPVVNRKVKIIADTYIDKEFGTGCLKVTPAHDINDYELGVKHGLESIDVINDDGTINAKGGPYEGKDRFVVRKLIIKDLKKAGLLDKVEQITNNVGFSERTDAVIEPKLSMQWFMKMEDLSKPALDHVLNGDIKFHPPKFINTYKHWMENIRDWCISRQLWWGHRIPAWYLPDNSIIVAATETEALKLAKEKDSSLELKDLKQDPDVLDTWASSWLWPISLFDGISDPNNEEIKYYYPTDDLVTAPEILFFWVARMIISGYEYRDEKPFKNVYLTGIVRDKQRRKMSKSLGNSPDPLKLIEEFGADGVRTGMLFSSPAGNDLLFDEKLVLQGRNFANKIWNAFRLVQGWTVDEQLIEETDIASRWFEAKLQVAIVEVEDHFSKYRVSDALMTLYKLIWNDFCSGYLEMIKPPYGASIDPVSKHKAMLFFDQLMRLIHPFIPFISEEIWQALDLEKESKFLAIANWPTKSEIDTSIISNGQVVMELISEIRNTRASQHLSPKQALHLMVKTNKKVIFEDFNSIIIKLINLDQIKYVEEGPQNAISFLIQDHAFFIPLEGLIDGEQEKEKLEKELKYTKGFKISIEKKLNNKRFVDNAPKQVVANERKKLADANAKIDALEKRIETI